MIFAKASRALSIQKLVSEKAGEKIRKTREETTVKVAFIIDRSQKKATFRHGYLFHKNKFR
ncbi:MAG: hypothetical protein AAB393_10000 [Bacteroidota bacterium]